MQRLTGPCTKKWCREIFGVIHIGRITCGVIIRQNLLYSKCFFLFLQISEKFSGTVRSYTALSLHRERGRYAVYYLAWMNKLCMRHLMSRVFKIGWQRIILGTDMKYLVPLKTSRDRSYLLKF